MTDTCEWCGDPCPAWSAMCEKCAEPLGGLPERPTVKLKDGERARALFDDGTWREIPKETFERATNIFEVVSNPEIPLTSPDEARCYHGNVKSDCIECNCPER